MHELGIVVHITKTLKSVVEENQLQDISRVTLEIGKISGIVPDYLIDCWNYYRKKVPYLKNSTLSYEWIEAITQCQDCKKEYDTISYGKECPYCHSFHTYLIQGNECNIKEIEAE